METEANEVSFLRTFLFFAPSQIQCSDVWAVLALSSSGTLWVLSLGLVMYYFWCVDFYNISGDVSRE